MAPICLSVKRGTFKQRGHTKPVNYAHVKKQLAVSCHVLGPWAEKRWVFGPQCGGFAVNRRHFWGPIGPPPRGPNALQKRTNFVHHPRNKGATAGGYSRGEQDLYYF